MIIFFSTSQIFHFWNKVCEKKEFCLTVCYPPLYQWTCCNLKTMTLSRRTGTRNKYWQTNTNMELSWEKGKEHDAFYCYSKTTLSIFPSWLILRVYSTVHLLCRVRLSSLKSSIYTTALYDSSGGTWFEILGVAYVMAPSLWSKKKCTVSFYSSKFSTLGLLVT